MRLNRLLLILGLCCAAAAPAGAQDCPADFTAYFADRPDDLAPGNTIVNGAFDITAITRFDPDGPGPQAPIIIAAMHYLGPADCAGPFTTLSEWSRLDRWNDTTQTWVPMTARFDGLVTCFQTFDEDLTGPNPPRLYIGGRFSGFGGASSPNIMRYDGSAFSAVRSGLNGTVWCMHVHDDDGPGATLPKLYIGGEFNAAPASASQGQVDCNRLIRLTGGQRWETPPGASFNDSVFALCSFDEDGPGLGIARLIVGGGFTANGTLAHNLISVWDGAVWTTLGNGLNPSRGTTGGRRVFALCEFDEDGAGPDFPSLFVGGTFIRAMAPQSAVSHLVIRWKRNDATSNAGWLTVPDAPDMDYYQDLQPPAYGCPGCSDKPLFGWESRVLCFLPLDLDGAGPLPTELYIGGQLAQYTFGGWRSNWGLMKWSAATNTTSWVQGAGGAAFGNCVSPWSTDTGKAAYGLLAIPATSVPTRLVIAGGLYYDSDSCAYSIVSGQTAVSGASAAFGLGGAGPGVSNPPDNTWVTLGPSTSGGFSLTASGTGPFTYRWRKDGVDLVNGTSQGIGAVIGSTGPALIIGGTANPVSLATQGWFDCRISNACGTGSTAPVWMVVQPDAAPFFPIRIDSPVAPVTSVIGNADLASLYDGANYPRFFTTLDTVPFAIAPTGANTWRARLAPGSATGNKTLTIPTSRAGVGQVCFLMNTEGGVAGTGALLTFNASGGRTWSTRLTGGNHLRTYQKAGGIQTVTSTDTQAIYENANNRLDRVRVRLPSDFRSRTLTSITITDEGTDSTSRIFMGGLTLRVMPAACSAADVAGLGGADGSDGMLTADDVVYFIARFMAGDLAVADIAGLGGSLGPDGRLTADDMVVFLAAYFAGC